MSYQIREMSFSELLDAAFRIVRDHFVLLVGISAVINLPVAVIGSEIEAAPGSAVWLRAVAMFLLLLIAGPIVSVALTYAIGEIYLGRVTTVGQSLRAALGLIVPFSGTLLLLYLGVIGGLLLLVIPGIYLMLVWMLTWQVMVFERCFGTAALRRSRALMRGNVWRAIGILLLSGLITAVLTSAFGAVFRLAPVLAPLARGIAQSVGGAYTATVAVLLYFDIRCRKEAFDLEHLAELVESAAPAGRPLPA
jgi:hypothetical protein